ncbi:GNAT family N-acetyltransferase [Clostridium butanoliproducens]|nr:GNAT family N-acetyltransferase [Clostridium butanoliproducens]
MELKYKALDYKEEHMKIGESELHGGALLDKMQYEDWLQLTDDNSCDETVHSDWVVSSTFFVYRKMDNKIIGMVDIRHTLNDFLRNYGGHIGFGVRPSERRKGYATQILNIALEQAKGLNLPKVMLACYKENEPSRKTILKCGGNLEKEFLYSDGKHVQIYWINI